MGAFKDETSRVENRGGCGWLADPGLALQCLVFFCTVFPVVLEPAGTGIFKWNFSTHKRSSRSIAAAR